MCMWGHPRQEVRDALGSRRVVAGTLGVFYYRKRPTSVNTKVFDVCTKGAHNVLEAFLPACAPDARAVVVSSGLRCACCTRLHLLHLCVYISVYMIAIAHELHSVMRTAAPSCAATPAPTGAGP